MEVTWRRHHNVKKSLKIAAKVLLDEVSEALEEEIVKEKWIWVREWIRRQNELGSSANLIRELAREDPEEYRMCLKMTPNNFETILNLITPSIQKKDTLLRDAIPARIKLQITLNYLATGNSYCSLQHLFRVSKSAISKLIPEVCGSICQVLKEYIMVCFN